MGLGPSYALHLPHGIHRVIYMAIYGHIWQYMIIYILKYVFGVSGHLFECLDSCLGVWTCNLGVCIPVGCLYTCRM